MSAIVTLLAGVVFGLALAAPPGPMNAVIAEESVLRGWLAGVKAGLGAMTADACFLGLSLLGTVAVVQRRPTLRAGMVGVGGLLMVYFAYAAARDAHTFVDEGGEDRRDEGRSKGFWKALALALTNPYQILFWLTIGVALLEPGTVDVLSHTPYVGSALGDLLVVQTGTPALLLGLFGGIGVWVTGFPATLVAARRRVHRLAPAVAYGSALVLAGFGALFLAEALGALL